LRRHLGAVQLVRQLDQDARTVAHQLVGTDRAAVVEVLEDLQPLLDDRVRFLALDVGHETDTARVVFVRRVVETVRRHVVALRTLSQDLIGDRRSGPCRPVFWRVGVDGVAHGNPSSNDESRG
jgi:hypothetical protein